MTGPEGWSVAGVADSETCYIPESVTRVVLVHDGGFTEKWAESWDVHVQDEGRTLKLFPRNPTGPRYEHTPGFFDVPPIETIETNQEEQ